MANKTKGGLGRGLNALMGSYVEEEPVITTFEKIKEQSEDNKQSRQVLEETEQIVPEDNITIKSVVSREPKKSVDSFRYRQEESNNEAQETNSIDSNSREANISTRQLNNENTIPKLNLENENITQKRSENQENQYNEVEIQLIHPNPDQPRTTFKKEELEELASSIEREGLFQPILVRKLENETFQIIAGERRWQACKNLSLEKVPVRIVKANDSKALELALVENIQRADLNPIEEAYGYRRIMERENITQTELAQRMSKGRSTIANALRLLDLPEDAQQLLFEEKITAGHARAILSVSSKEGRQKITEKLVRDNLSVRETENLARLLEHRPPSQTSGKTAVPKSFKIVAKELRKLFNTKVRVKTVQGKNKIEIEFVDEADLRRIYERMIGEL